MMAFSDDAGAETELRTRLLSDASDGDDSGAVARSLSATVTLSEDESASLLIENGYGADDDNDYELISEKETRAFEDEIRMHRAYQNGAGGTESLFQTYLMNKIQPGSVKGSMFTMTVAIVGAGVLALPYAMEQSGLAMGLLLISGCAVATNFTLRLLVTCAEMAQARSYMDLAFITGGTRLASFTQFVVCMNLFGTSVGYLVGSAELMQLAMRVFLHEDNHSFLLNRQTLLLLLCLCFVFPLALFRSLESLRFTSLFSIVCIVFMTLVVVIKYFQFVHLGDAPDIAYQLTHLPLFEWKLSRQLTAIPLVIFAYTCHPNVLPIYLVLKRRSSPRMFKVLNRSIGLSAIVYALCGVFVVFTFGEHTKSNFLKNNYHHDGAVLVGCIGFGLALVLTVPLFLHTLRDNLREALLQNRKLSLASHLAISSFLVMLVLIVAELSGDIASVLSVLGATTNPVICFVLPAYFIHRIGSGALGTQQRISLMLAIITSVVSVCSLLQQMHVLS